MKIKYFVPDNKKSGVRYKEISSIEINVDTNKKVLILSNKVEIFFENIININ